MTMDKDAYLEEIQKKFEDLNKSWEIERDKFNAKQTSAETQKEIEAKRQELRQYRTEMEEKISDLKSADENALSGVMNGTEDAWKSLFKAFKDLATYIKE
jgi:hypothetical protein